MIDGAAAQKARTAMGFFLHNSAAWSHGRGASGVGGPENRDYWQSHGCGHVHRAGIIADKEMALTQQGREIGYRRFACEIDRGVTHR